MRRIVLCLLAATALAAAAPQVSKVEPPSWWIGSTINPIRLLIRGADLNGARVTAPAGLVVSSLKANEKGTYLFADLNITPNAKPGQQTLTLTTTAGKTSFQFEVLPRLNRTGRFQGFTANDVMYLIMPDRFANGDPSNDDPASAKGLLDRKKRRYYHGGDFEGIIQKLPYLKDLGVTAIWINPWYDNNDQLNQIERYDNEDITDYHGYGAIDFYGVEQHFGDLAKLKELIEKAHAAGIKIIQDQVANHTGPYHPWVKNPPTPTWFNGTQQNHISNDWQTWTLMDPNGNAQLRRTTLDGWFVNILPDLNQHDPEARRYLIQNALWWVGVTGLDGIRQDTMPYVPRDFWRDWSAALKKEFPSINLVGEVLDGNPVMTSFFQGGAKRFDGIDTGMPSVFDFPLMFAMRKSFAEGQSMREVVKTLANDYLYSDPRQLVTLVGLHDVKRFLNEKDANDAALKLAFTTIFSVRGIPLVYYGDEIGMEGEEDPDNRRDFPGGWTEDSRNAFNATNREQREQSTFEHVRRLAQIRREHQALRAGETAHLYADDDVFAYARFDRSTDRPILVVLNKARESKRVRVPVAACGLRDSVELKDLLGSPITAVANAGIIELELPAQGSVILR
jgi:glycosidase